MKNTIDLPDAVCSSGLVSTYSHYSCGTAFQASGYRYKTQHTWCIVSPGGRYTQAMAAAIEAMAGPELVDLRNLVGRELDPLLLEETVEWQRKLDWDFGRSADLVRQFADMRALMG